MNWISNYVRPKINAIFSKKDTPENLWTKCPSCGMMLFHREVKDSLYVCNGCGHHMQISSTERLLSLFDGGIYSPIETEDVLEDPLQFKDTKKYAERIRETRKITGEKDAMVISMGDIGKLKVTVAVQNFNFMGGSMGMAVGNSIIAGVNNSLKHKTPFVLFSAAGGARMQESILSLMQMPRSIVAIQSLREEKLPYVVVLTNPTTGGVTASYAMLGDVTLAEPNALICFAGPRVIEQTIREKLPEGFQKSEYLLEHGMIDQVIPRDKIKNELIILLHILMKKPRAIRGNIKKAGEEKSSALK
ncbi:MAG: acetyl-CoA carboxylase, carboxyltransferase subunit beta [Paracoccaceae bacterium]|nr:acetyl-CoA carboxylase, carboxyltransferase subunit beta [Paracoccaceae bacterium]